MSGVAAFVCSIVLGFFFFTSTFEFQQKRSTASLKNQYDLTCLSGEELSKAIINRIVLGLKGVRKEGNLGIHIGHYTFSDSEADKKAACLDSKERSISSAFTVRSKKMACEIYPRIHYVFVADGESESGSKRQLDVEAPCTVSSDLGRTDITWIPWKQLSLETPFDGVSEYNKPSRVTLKTQNISDKWPDKWILDRIQLEGESGMISVDAPQIREVAGRPIIFEFN